MGIGNVIGGAVAGSGIPFISGAAAGAMQGANLNYQKNLQQQIFAREDNSVQRRANDLEAAGLSKTLAAGSSAGAGQVVNTSAPQQGSDNAEEMFKLITMDNNIAQNDQQLINLKKTGKSIDAQTRAQNASAAIDEYEKGLVEGTGLSTRNQSEWAQIIKAIGALVQPQEDKGDTLTPQKYDEKKYHNYDYDKQQAQKQRESLAEDYRTMSELERKIKYKHIGFDKKFYEQLKTGKVK